MVFQEAITLLVSLAILSKSSDFVVENAVNLSRFFGLSKIAVGALLLAVSTSLPELSVSVLSATIGGGAIALGNVFGSSITNILLVLGFGGFLYGITIRKRALYDVSFILLFSALLPVYIILSMFFNNQALGFIEGFVLLLLFAVYAYYSFVRKIDIENGDHVTTKQALQSFVIFFFSIIVVLISAGFVVDSALKLATQLNIAQSFIGATIIAVGTSLPELTIDLKAIRRKHYDLAIGDAIGSNLINTTLVLGTAAVINPIVVSINIFSVILMFVVLANFLFLYVASTQNKLNRFGGLLFLIVYVLYFISIFYMQASELVT